jgi:hypothetical protein
VLLNSKFTIQNKIFSATFYQFAYPNQGIEMLSSVNAELEWSEKSEIEHFWRILNERANARKYASFERVEIGRTPLNTAIYAKKKRL